MPTHASAKERLILAESKSLQSDVIADQKSASEWDASDELPASADIGDTLIEGWYGEQVRYLRFAMAGYAEPAHPLLFLPLFKPPPI